MRGQVNESRGVGGISKGLLAKNRHYTSNSQLVQSTDLMLLQANGGVPGSAEISART
jgi:hypothetical protein